MWQFRISGSIKETVGLFIFTPLVWFCKTSLTALSMCFMLINQASRLILSFTRVNKVTEIYFVEQLNFSSLTKGASKVIGTHLKNVPKYFLTKINVSIFSWCVSESIYSITCFVSIVYTNATNGDRHPLSLAVFFF